MAKPLFDLALDALCKDPVGGSELALPGTFALVPSPACDSLFDALIASLRASAAPSELSPPIEALRLFYGSRQLERLVQHGADDAWAAEVCACSALPALTALDLRCARLSAFGAGSLAVTLRGLAELRLPGCRTLGSAGLAQLVHALRRLHTLDISECHLRICAAEASDIAQLPALTSLDLGGNSLDVEGAAALGGARGLRSLSVWGSPVGDAAAMAATQLPHLGALDLGWTGLTAEGAQCVPLSGSGTLRSLSLAFAALPQSEVGGAPLAAPLAACTSLTSINLGGIRLSLADLRAAASIPALTVLDLGHARVDACAADTCQALCDATRLAELAIEGVVCLPPPQPAADTAREFRAGARRIPNGCRAPIRTLRAARSALVGGAFATAFNRTAVRALLVRLDLSGCCDGSVVLGRLLDPPIDDAGVRAPALPSLRVLLLADANADERTVHALARGCQRLTELDLSRNPAVDDAALGALGYYLDESLEILRLDGLPRVSAHALDALGMLRALVELHVDGCGLSAQEAEARLGVRRRADAARDRAAASIGMLRGAQESAEAEARAAAAARGPRRYEMAEMLALREAPLARVPPRPLGSLVHVPGGVRIRSAPYGSAPGSMGAASD